MDQSQRHVARERHDVLPDSKRVFVCSRTQLREPGDRHHRDGQRAGFVRLLPDAEVRVLLQIRARDNHVQPQLQGLGFEDRGRAHLGLRRDVV